MTKFFLRVACALSLIFCAGCAPSYDKEAVLAPVNGYLEAISQGDLEAARSFETEDCDGKNNILNEIDKLEDGLSSMDMGKTFNQEAMDFMKEYLELGVQSYKTGDISEKDGVLTVSATVEGVNLQEENIAQLMSESEAELTEEITKFAEDNAGETDDEKIYGGLGKILFEKMYANVKAIEPSSSNIIFTVEKQEDGTWLISAIN